jgi:TldD protein
MTTLPSSLRAPFSPGGSASIDSVVANRLLSIALEAGGDYADLYFEFRVSADYALEEEQIRTLEGITLGRACASPRATRRVRTEDLAWEKMAHAARTAGQMPRAAAEAGRGRRSPSTRRASTRAGPIAGRACRRQPRPAPPMRLRARPRIVKVRRRSPRRSKEVLVHSDGRMANDIQPLSGSA